MNCNNCGLIIRCEWESDCYINGMEFKFDGKSKWVFGNKFKTDLNSEFI